MSCCCVAIVPMESLAFFCVLALLRRRLLPQSRILYCLSILFSVCLAWPSHQPLPPPSSGPSSLLFASSGRIEWVLGGKFLTHSVSSLRLCGWVGSCDYIGLFLAAVNEFIFMREFDCFVGKLVCVRRFKCCISLFSERCAYHMPLYLQSIEFNKTQE